MMKVSILTPDLSQNCLGRAWLLGKVLERRYKVEIVGPQFGTSVWAPLLGEFLYVNVRGRRFPAFLPEIIRMLNRIEGDVIYASKPLFTSYTVGLIKKCLNARPLVLDVDDWERPFYLRYYGRKDVLYPNCYLGTVLNEKLVHLADAVTVSNRFLQKRFGGTLVPHVRDTRQLDPSRFDSNRSKKKFGLIGKKVIIYWGTPKPHKGLEDLIVAVSTIEDKNVLLMIVGLDKSQYAQSIRRYAKELLGADRLVDIGLTTMRDLPELMSVADLAVIPQRKTLESLGQVPARVFDAMAMAKPIIATNVSHLREIIEDCGWIVEPENTGELAENIREVLGDLKNAHVVGEKAREKCIRLYSYDAAERVLVEIFEHL